MKKQPPLVVLVRRATQRILLFLFIVSLSLLPQLMLAKTPGCPCNPCKCSVCTCGGGGKGGDKHHGEEKKGERARVAVGVNVDLGGVGQRNVEGDPFGSTSVVRHAKKTENIKKVAKRKEVRKTEQVTDPTIDLTQDLSDHPIDVKTSAQFILGESFFGFPGFPGLGGDRPTLIDSGFPGLWVAYDTLPGVLYSVTASTVDKAKVYYPDAQFIDKVNPWDHFVPLSAHFYQLSHPISPLQNLFSVPLSILLKPPPSIFPPPPPPPPEPTQQVM